MARFRITSELSLYPEGCNHWRHAKMNGTGKTIAEFFAGIGFTRIGHENSLAAGDAEPA